MKTASRTLLALVLAVPLVAPAIAQGPPGPPPPPVEHYGAAPYPGGVWIGGHYEWRARRWAWRPGYWGRPPRPGVVWVPGHYNGYRWIPGHWR